MFNWRGLDTKEALKRLYVVVTPFAVPFLVAVIFVAYQNSLGQSFNFFTWYGVFTYSFFGLRYFGELVFPVITGTTVLVALLFISSLIPIFIIVQFTDIFIRPFMDVTGFGSFGKVCGTIKSFIAQSLREKLLVGVLGLTSMLAILFLSLVFLSLLGIIVINLSSLRLLLLLFISSLLVSLYFGSRIKRALKNYTETLQT